ncbi:unnamed protein product [Caenorhabditis nigoni]
MVAFIASCFFTLFLHCMAGYAEKKKSWTFLRNAEIIFIILLVISIVLFLAFPFLLVRARGDSMGSQEGWTKFSWKTYEMGLVDGFILQSIFVFIIVSIFMDWLKIDLQHLEMSLSREVAEMEAETFV